MSKMKFVPKTYAQAVEALAGRASVKLGNNTWLENFPDGIKAVRLHDTYIVQFWPDGRVTLYSGGYRTVTTKDRMNQFISGHVSQKNCKWFYTSRLLGEDYETVPFVEGMDVLQ